MKASFILLSAILVISGCIPASSSAEGFSVRQDGGIRVDGLSFATVREYLVSDYFRANGKRCGTRPPEGFFEEEAQRSAADCTLMLTRIQSEYWPEMVFTLPVWWHVISRSDGLGNIPDSAIAAQMEVLNQDYRAQAGTMGAGGFDVNIRFELAGITRTVNNGWFTDSAADEAAYKQALARDPGRYVNIYTNDASGFLGYAYYPQGSAGQYWDGIVLFYGSVGGRNNGFYPYDQGRTLVHEMGHYLGLYHTFNAQVCSNTYSTADLVVDTNAENQEHYTCSQTFTCGTADPIHNYMNYTYDFCMNHFTREQANRAVCSLLNYRPGFITSTVPSLIMPLILKND